MTSNRLEYEEEDLFGSEGELDPSDSFALANINPSVPIMTPLPPATAASSSSRQVQAPRLEKTQLYPQIISGRSETRKDGEARLTFLREKKREGRQAESLLVTHGVRTLKSCSMSVVQANAARIWDIGDLEYAQVKAFLDDLPMEQLSEIENNSPHIMKDTDWLWEIFLLQDFRPFHERCQTREGQPRTSGWRRMYKKAKDDAAERRLQAGDRVAARYKQLEDEKKSKSIVVLEKPLPVKKPRSNWGKPSTSSRGAVSSTKPATAASAIAKARVESQRARIALTHASGRYVPPVNAQQTNAQRIAQSQLFKNPFLPNASSSTSSLHRATPPMSSAMSRLPPPKRLATRAAGTAITNRESHRSPGSSPIPGSYPTAQSARVRASLPPQLSNRPGPSPSSVSPSGDRFRIDGTGNKKDFKEIKKPQMRSFEAPKLEKEKGNAVVDLFGTGVGPDGGGIFRVKKRKAGEGPGSVKRSALGR